MIDPTRDAHWRQRELLAAEALFEGLPAALFGELVAASRVLDLPAQGVLYQAGDPVREAFVLASGSAVRKRPLPGGGEKVLELAHAPQVLGLSELFGATHHGASCRVLSHSVVLAIDVCCLRAVIRQDSALSWRIIQALAARQCATEFDVTSHHSGATGAQRILDYLLEQAGDDVGLAGETAVVLKASKKIIAARIGMTPESFSRSLRRLSEQGIVVVEGRKVYIQHAALADIEAGNAGQRLRFVRGKTQGDASGARIAPGMLVNLCGRCRVVSQRMTIAWAMAAAGIAAEKAWVRLRRLELEFERVLVRLAALELPENLDLHRRAVVQAWPGYRAALSADGASPARAAEIFGISEAVLEAAERLTGAAASVSASPGVHYVNVAGRNRMLSQRICKLFLLGGWIAEPACVRREIDESIREFERNLGELWQGGRDTAELSAQLQEVSEQWRKFVHAMAPGVSRTPWSQHVRLVVAESERLLRHVDTAVKLYERLAPAERG